MQRCVPLAAKISYILAQNEGATARPLDTAEIGCLMDYLEHVDFGGVVHSATLFTSPVKAYTLIVAGDDKGCWLAEFQAKADILDDVLTCEITT